MRTRRPVSDGRRRVKEERRSARAIKWLLRRARIALIFVALCAVSLWIWHILTTSPSFEIERIEIIGAKRTGEADFKNITADIRGQNIFSISLGEYKKRIEKHTWVKTSALYRRLPDCAEICLIEHAPIAFTRLNGVVYWVSEEGVVIDAVKSPSYKNEKLPVITNGTDKNIFAEEARALCAIKKEYPEIFSRIKTFDGISENRFELRFADYDGSIFVHREDVLRNLGNMRMIWENLTAQYSSAEYIDLRWRNQVVVMPSKKYGTEQ